jgi:hypothetical protein
MNIRRQVFASEFSSEFKKILRREIANSDVLGKCRVRGVLVARGLVAPVLVACCKALRHALTARKQTLMTRKRDSIFNEYPMRTTTIATVTIVVLALVIVAKSRTVGLTEAIGNPVQNTMSIYDLDVGHANMKNLPVQEIPLP